MKNNKNLKFKILLTGSLLLIVSLATYISLPNVSKAVESKLSDIKNIVGKITTTVGSSETNEKIREHRGYWNYNVSYESATKPYGINNIDTYISNYLEDAYNSTYGWSNSLRYNTSIFCQQKNTPFPHPTNLYLKTFHIGLVDTHRGGWSKANKEGDIYTDYIEHLKHDSWYQCTGKNTLNLLPTNWTFEDVDPHYVNVDEFQFDWRGVGSSIAGDENAENVARSKEFIQHTLVTVDYSASAPYFDPMQAYYFAYSTRAYYTNDPAQHANWQYKNGYAASGTGLTLYNAAAAVTHTLYGKVLDQTSNPSYGNISIIKPEMSTTNESGTQLNTGTIIDTDGTSYKVGPIYMKDYTYAYSTYVKDFSGTSSLSAQNTQDVISRLSSARKEFYKGLICGIIEMKIELDNNKTLYVDGSNVKIIYGSIDSGRATFQNTYYEAPALHAEYVFPSPKSEFYLDIPISSCEGATKITKITTRYKWTEVDGEVGDLTGTFHDLEWTGNKQLSGCAKNGGYECTNVIDNYECQSKNQTACYHTMNYYKHNFECGTSGWCQYGSSASSTSSADVSSGSTRYTDKITSSCSSTWACGKYYHIHGNTWSNGSDGQDHVNDSATVHKYCKCSHTHTYGCFSLNCNLSDGEIVCTKSEHTHGSDCKHWHYKNDCEKGEDGKYDCGYDSGDIVCTKKEHTHGTSCKHEHSGSSANGSGCYGKQDCPHYPGTSTCANLNGCCSYYVHTHSIGDCGKTHDCSRSYCIHGFDGGTHTCGKTDEHKGTSCSGPDWGDTHIGDCYGCGDEGKGNQDEYGATDEPSRCTHGHAFCAKAVWKCTDDTVKNSQKLNYVKRTEVYEKTTECYIEEIPLVVRVEIDKYIYDVEHAKTVSGATDNTFGPSDDRKLLEETTKEGNPVYVESDDYVTYKIILKNFSAFGVKVRIDDILPDSTAYKFISAYVGQTKITDLSKLRDSIIQINAESEASATITLQVKALEGKYENKGRIITRNGTPKNDDDDIDYIRTVDDNGPVVNHIETTCQGNTNTPDWESSDWFMLNNYNAFIDKYVYKYDEKVLADNNDKLGITEETSIVDKDGKLLQEVNGKDVSRRNINKTTTTVSDGNVEDIIRTDAGAREKYKEEHPVNVEQTEKITYAIRVSNEAKEIAKEEPTGTKPATQFKNIRVEDKLHEGLKYSKISAKIYEYVDGINDKFIKDVTSISCSGSTTVTDDLRTYYITALTGKDDILEANQYIEFYMETTVVQSNMYLHSMSNSAELTAASNVNDVIIYDRDNNIDRMISEQTASKEFVRMKDLLISGKVWLDLDKNGLMDDKARGDLDKINNNINNDAMKENVLVKLYRVEGDKATEIRRTRTDENGLYTFARKEGSTSWYGTFNNTVDYEKDDDGVNGGKYQRIDKANGKDGNGNYTAESQYYSYYVEFEYDGVVYKSTEKYAGMDNLTKNDGRYNANYLIDSNAAELEVDRNAFNKRYEYISYNVAYDLNNNKSGDLVFQKDGHSSYLMEDPSRDMTSKSFVLKYNADEVLDACDLAMNSCGSAKWKQCSNHWDDWQVVIAMGLIDESKYPNTSKGRKDAQAYLKTIYDTLSNNTGDSGNTQLIKYLWLYAFNESVDNTIPETDYLKYINLGLELREDVDLALTKDVYNLKTTINGEEMEYDYNLGNTGEYLNDYIVKKPYGFEVYESDYKYRVEQYIAKAVEAYKGANGEDELNIEVTYRINVKNVPTTDDDSLPKAKDTKLYARVHEILDLYDENFVEYKDGKDAIKAKIKKQDGFLINKDIQIAEAWMFMKKSEAQGKELLEEGQTYKERTTSGEPIYVKHNEGEFVKVKLQMSDNSKYSAKTNNFESDGYHTSYITGMENKVLAEGEDFDIYVKYVVDKAKLEIEVDESYNETQTVVREAYTEETKEIETVTMTNDNITAVITNIVESTITDGGATRKVTTAEIDRAIKLKDNRVDTNAYKKEYGRGTENIAQIDAYSIWYNQAGTNPASLVDKDSNAGNIGIKNTSTNKSPNGTGYSEGTTSADDVEFYEDMTYKTGIELAAEGTEQTRNEIEETYRERLGNEITIIKVTAEYDPIRKITGKVWDDSRTDTLGTGNEIQYVGDGIYDTSKTKILEAKDNKLVELNYKDSSVTEAKDIAVRNAKAEFIEIVQTSPDKFYEEVLTNVTWHQVQNARTDKDGFYMLEGFRPGRYIVRFTYGDTINEETYNVANAEALSEEQRDMLIFNGQDYKSTKYTGVTDNLSSVDEVIKAFEKAGVSDARDDEARRLEVNAYSEVMTNEMAEILKGLANGNKKLTPNSPKNSVKELKALTDNTYMQADTREFTVKTEKLIESADILIDQKEEYSSEYMYRSDLPYYRYLTALKNDHINARNFTIENVDLGIEYRPESQISLMKEIKEITLTTEDGDVLVNLHFKTIDDGSDRKHEIIKEDSIGYELVQFITNNYVEKTLINNVMSEESLQGLVYIQVDEEILQGCTIEITYGFEAQNSSEIDRISKKLNSIRYRDNKATDDLIEFYNNKYTPLEHKQEVLDEFKEVMNTKYTASGLSKAAIYLDAYAVDDQNLLYREIPKTTTTDGDDGYYGRFVGHGYYVGNVSDLDTISVLKFDKILDYIDTNLEYEQKTNSEEMVNKLWSKITSRELVGLVSHYKDIREEVKTMAEDSLPKVTNIDGVEYKSMVVSVDDRNVDPGDPNDTEPVKNKELSRFLLPKVSIVGMNGKDVVGTPEYEKYTGHIYLDVSKVLAAGSDDDDKTYENMAEIVQFTTLNGRRTNFATTIGNADIKTIKQKLDDKVPPFDNIEDNPNSGSIEFITASIEPDTSATETITLIPPTGLMRSRRPIVTIMEATKKTVEVISIVGLVVAIIGGITVAVIFTIRRKQTKRVK